jgi:23S rRNA (cytosine1962-C5)-methyltransferase
MSAPFASLWPAWDARRVLAEDTDMLVVDKPAGVSTAPDAGRSDDAVSRLRAMLAAREGVAPERVYLAVHQRLERDTSGVLVLSRRKSANASLAVQFEKDAARRVYVAAVAGWPRGREGEAGARVAWRLLERVGDRALVELRPPRGGTAAVRAAVASVAGALGGAGAQAPAHRLLLHLHALTIEAPSTGRAVTFTAPIPRALTGWVRRADVLADDAALDEALHEAADRRYALAGDASTDAFRLANDAGDGVPGVTVDRYGDWALVQFYTPEATAARERVLDAVSRLGARGVYAKFRPRQANVLVDTRREDLAPARALRGEDAPGEFEVIEGGLRYRVRLGDGLSTGIFLDQRGNRRRVREASVGRSVLNLFAYTCPFTVAAAAGGAARTVSVDVSAGALAWGERNLAANGLAGPQHVFARSDVFGWLDGARARRDRFDLIILDPPSYSTTKEGSRFASASDYRSLAARVFPLIAPGGPLLACSNHRGIVRARLRRFLHEAARDAGRAVTQMRDLPDPEDFLPLPGHEVHLKSVLVTVG